MSPNKVFLISAPGKVFEGATSSALLEKGVASFLLYGKAAFRGFLGFSIFAPTCSFAWHFHKLASSVFMRFLLQT